MGNQLSEVGDILLNILELFGSRNDNREIVKIIPILRKKIFFLVWKMPQNQFKLKAFINLPREVIVKGYKFWKFLFHEPPKLFAIYIYKLTVISYFELKALHKAKE